MTPDLVLTAAAVLSLLNLIFAIYISITLKGLSTQASVDAIRQLEAKFSAIEGQIVGIDRMVRDELARGRDETANASRMLREEITGSFASLSDATRGAMKDLGDAQQGRLEDFSKRLDSLRTDLSQNATMLRDQVGLTLTRLGDSVRESVQALSTSQAEKLDGVTKQVSGMADGTQRRQEELRTALDARLTDVKTDTANQGKALREEIATSLKTLAETIMQTMDRLGAGQAEKLEGVTKQVAALAEGTHRRQEELRTAVDAKLTEVKTDTSNQGKALREEISSSLTALFETITQTMDRLGITQAEKLEGVARQIEALIEGTERQQQALRLSVDSKFQEIRTDAVTNANTLKDDVSAALKRAADQLTESVRQISQVQHDRLNQMSTSLADLTTRATEQQEKLRQAVEERLDRVRTENAAKLEEMRQTVDEKLQGTLEQRLGASFKLVSDQLEQVYKSVGEMQTLAIGVGDLKKVLTNVKARGTWGEVTLGNLLEQILTSDQFAKNVEVRPGSNQRVEFAIRLPGPDADGEIWLPLDAKFPQEDYDRLVDAADRADPEGVEAAARGMEARMRSAAKDIHDKYISPPHSTDFGILFLPTEGLFAEIVRRPGLVDALQRDFRVVVAGPTTLVSILNSLRMGFRTLAIQKRSSEVWKVLGAVKTEFGKYGEVMDKVQKKLSEASSHIDMVARRRRAIDRKLREVESLPEAESSLLLDVTADVASELVVEEV